VLTDLRRLRRICCICCLALLAACENSRVINWNPDDYTVRSGDSIYSIAWKYELDPFQLARWNHISSPYVIHPGQRLHTREIEGEVAVAVAEQDRSSPDTPVRTKSESISQPVPAATAIIVRDGDTLYSLAKRNGITAAKLARINALKSPYLLRPGQTLSLKSKSIPKSIPKSSVHRQTKSVAIAPEVRHKKSVVESDNRQVRWSWPVTGAVVNRFSNSRSDSKGIDIAGREGSPVRAAAPGKVVYSGNGLISYGNLVIIKHNHAYLSAYAYNRKLLVSEGDSVRAGQKIAELGRSGTDSPRLHFEIRKYGKPVNPLSYLPSS
jgi:lipoprotein NlpD